MASENKRNDSDETEQWKLKPPYLNDQDFKPKYAGKCDCGKITIECSTDPLDVKICHCNGCQKIHGSSHQIAAILHKTNIRFTNDSFKYLKFYSSERKINEHILPCKLSCNYCGTMIADEGRNMFLVFPSIFDFKNNVIPDIWKPRCHIFYGQRVVDIDDKLPKWLGHKKKSQLYQSQL